MKLYIYALVRMYLKIEKTRIIYTCINYVHKYYVSNFWFVSQDHVFFKVKFFVLAYI